MLYAYVCQTAVAFANPQSFPQEVPSLPQAQIFERTADFSNLSLDPARVDPSPPSTSQTQAFEARERSRTLAIRLLKLAQKCRVRLRMYA